MPLVGRPSQYSVVNYWHDGSGMVQVWDASIGETIWSSDGQSTPLFPLAWSPDGRFIASGGRDGTTQVWQPI